MNSSAAHEHNRRAWDQRVQRGERFTRPAKDADFTEALTALDDAGWLSEMRGKRVLCLAAGGGRQGPLYAASGAEVTVVDISPAQLELDREVATERGLEMRTIETSMDDLSMFQPGEFDIVIQPVSTCYVPDLRPVYQNVARVLRGGGLYISQHKQPTSLQTSHEQAKGDYRLAEPYYRSGPLPQAEKGLVREAGTLEFLHRWEQIVGGLCRAGFVIEDLQEPRHDDAAAEPGTFAHRSLYAAPYVRIKARRVGGFTGHSSLWLPNDDPS